MIAVRLLPVRPVSEETPATEMQPNGVTVGWKPLAGLLAVILLVRALQSGGIGVVMTFTNVYLDEALKVPTSRIGLITGFGRLLGVPMSLTVPWLVNRFGNFKLVHLSLGLIALLILPLALLPYWPVAALAVIGISSMGSIRYLSFIGFTMALVSDKQRSLISGTNGNGHWRRICHLLVYRRLPDCLGRLSGAIPVWRSAYISRHHRLRPFVLAPSGSKPAVPATLPQ